MKKIVIVIFGAVVLLAGFLLIGYPFISNYLMSRNQDSEIEAYELNMRNASEELLQEAWENAEAYNESLLGNVVLTDPFDPGAQPEKNETYENLLNINGDSMMATLEIPKIDVSLPVYHGTDENTLSKGVGHLQKTSLPIGGKGTHAVLTGHTGLPTARLFTDLNQLEEEDVFYLHTLNQILAYQVDQIKVVEPSETEDLRVDNDEDYVTLITCTPYGVNSHRLLVRGIRIPYEEAKKIEEQTVPGQSTWMLQYKRALLAGGAALLGSMILIIVIRKLYARYAASLKNKSK